MDVNLPDFDYKPPPHCKKKPWELKTRQYTDKEMLSCIEKVTSGHKTFREAVDGTGIRISSLYYKLKQLRNGGELRPPQGPKKKFTESTENEMAQYCEFCWEIGIPKTQDRFSQEMIHYMEYNGITNPFRTTQPGPGWFRRFRSEHPSVMFLRKGQEHKYKDDNIRHSSWVCDNIRFIRENNNGYLCWCPESIFIVEAQKLVWKGYQDFALWVVIPYNSCGQVIQPMIVHNGELNDKVQHYFGDKFRFIMSEDGELNYDASVAAVELIERYMDSFAIESPAVVYFDPNMARTICLCAWKSAWDSNILMRQIHRRIYEDKMTDCEKTIFCKIQPAFHRKMQTNAFRIQTPQGFVQGLFEIISKCQYRQHMRTIFTQLNIITIEEQIRSDLDYPSNDQKNNQHTFVTNNPLPSHQQPQVTYTNEDGEYYYDLPAVSKAVPVNRYHSESNADVVHPSIDMAPCNFANQNGDEQTDDIPWGVMAGIYQLSHILSEGIDNCHSNTSPQLIDDSPPNTEASKQMVSLQSSGNQTAKENVSQDCDVVESIAELQCETLWSDFDSNEFDWAQEFDDLLPDEGYQNEITDIYQCHGLSPCITDDSTTHVQSAKDGMEASINVQGNDANNRSKVQVKLGTSAKKDGIDCLPTVQSFEAISPPQKLLAELRPNVQTDYQHEVSRYKSTNNHDNSPSQEPDSDPYAKFFGFDQSQMYLGWETISNKLLRIGRRTNNEHCQDD